MVTVSGGESASVCFDFEWVMGVCVVDKSDSNSLQLQKIDESIEKSTATGIGIYFGGAFFMYTVYLDTIEKQPLSC